MKALRFALIGWTLSPGMLRYHEDHPRLYHVVTAAVVSLALGIPLAAFTMIAMVLLA